MRGLIALTFLLCAFQAVAAETITTIVSVVDSARTHRLLVLSGVDGRVYKVDSSREMKEYLETMKGRTVKIDYTLINGEAIITNVLAAATSEDTDFFTPNQTREFEATDLGNLDNVKRVFGILNPGDESRTQCFKRAHIWAWDMWSREGIMSKKVYIFWSRRYIQLEEYDWWFHVAPVVTAGGVDYAMDKTFFNKPVTVQEWKNRFMRSSITCPVIDNYNDYESQPWSKLCFLTTTPMWYFRPADIRNRDQRGIEKTSWVLMELQDARRAFENGEQVYEALDTGRRTQNH